MIIKLHQTHNAIGNFNKVFKDIETILSSKKKEKITLHLFPELFLTGYPLQDLCLQKAFIDKYQNLINKINEFSSLLDENNTISILLGGLEYQFDENNLPQTIYNVIFQLNPSEKLQVVYRKQLLPNYDIFDEKKYFAPGKENSIISFNDTNIALLICEDMWPTSSYSCDPCDELEKSKNDIDCVVNLSASPYHLGKHTHRLERGTEISQKLEAPFVYVNRVGGEDEILFDGRSFIIENGKNIINGQIFKKDILEYNFKKITCQEKITINKERKLDNTWEGLFNPDIQLNSHLPTLTEWTDNQCEEILNALIFGFQEYTQKCGFNNFVIALSGGMDSALVLSIVKLGLLPTQKVEAIYMPGQFSSALSLRLSEELCSNLQINLSHLPIKFLHSASKNAFLQFLSIKLDGLADENIQSRLRGMLLYARSNQTGSMAINTSNKSEIAIGYSTLYGDSVGAISLLGDLYKTQVYRLANFINERYDNLIPKDIIDRPPSAELRDNQRDDDYLSPYERLDVILEGLLSYRYSAAQLIDLGFKKEEVEQVFNLYQNSEYKRNQFCPIIKIRAKSFGFGHRIPISKIQKIYT